ncbi:S28 family serine protease, partial [Pyxidicoccus sp. 3LG]
MRKFFRRPFTALVCALTVGLQACGEGIPQVEEGQQPPTPQAVVSQALQSGALDEAPDILAALQAIPGLTVVREAPSRYPGTRFFVLSYDQPVDHKRPEARRFQQRITLLHRSTQAPMVLASSGYGIGTSPTQFEPTALLQANQLYVEHRFFGPSTPEPATYEHLTLEQAATDHHRIVKAFKPLYGGKWVSTGGSKGGMTSIYHRALYSRDVDATVAYVAPNSYGPQDPRYIQFLSRVGDAACRERIQAFQRDVLSRREELTPLMVETVVAQGDTLDVLGADKAFEFLVLELPFSFFQYTPAEFCTFIPAPGAPVDEVVSALDGIVGFYNFSDSSLHYYAPYYFQAGTQLGSYRSDERHLRDLVRYPRQYVPESMVPFSMEGYHFNYWSMPLIEAWVKGLGERILLVYGENDPWSTGAFEVRQRNDSYRFF